MSERKPNLDDIQRILNYAEQYREIGRIPESMAFCHTVMKNIVIHEMQDPVVMIKLINSSLTQKQLMASNSIVIEGMGFLEKALKLQSLKNPNTQSVMEAFVMAESCLWNAAKLQIETGDIANLVKTIAAICDLHAKKGIFDDSTEYILSLNKLLVSQMELSHKFDNELIVQLRKINSKIHK